MDKYLISIQNHITFSTLIINIIFLSYNCFSQDYGYQDRDFILPHHTEIPSFASPEVAGLGKYVDIPISLYTGVPEISIPLYKIEINDFSLPISLSYHSSGIKVEDIASWVGLGWSLNAGGVITRAVKGIPDDLYQVNNSPVNAGYLYSGEIISDYCEGIGSLSEDQFNDLSHGELDGEPDIFYFNFLGYTGKFVFDHDGSVNLFEKNNLEISYSKESEGVIDEFVILTGNGIEVTFAAKEILSKTIGVKTTHIFRFNWDDPTPQTSYPVAWHISQIEFQNTNETISFQYEDEEMETIKRNRQEYRKSEGEWSSNFYNDRYCFQSKRLETIIWDNGLIEFDSDHLRQDYDLGYLIGDSENAKALTGIIIVDVNNNPILSYIFDYSYFEGNTIDNDLLLYNEGYSKRLKLEKIYQESNNGLRNGTYFFDYDNTPMPHRFSYEQDFWGYYNANYLNGLNPDKTILPNFYEYPWDGGINEEYNEKYLSPFSIFERSNSSSSIFHDDFADRVPNPEVIQACILKKITYPTGGYHEFIYEPNEFYLDGQNINGGGVRIKKTIATDNLIPGNNITKEYFYTNADDPSISSGRVIYLPQFVKGKRLNPLPQDNHTIFSTSLGGLGSTHGSIVGYEEVMVKQTGKGSSYYKYNIPATFGEETANCVENGNCIYNRTISELIEFADWWNVENTSSNFPFPPDPNYDWNRGQLLEQKTINNLDIIIKHITNEYQIHEFNKINSLFVKDVFWVCYEANCFYNHKYGKYYYLSTWKTLWKTTETIYDNNGENGISTTIEYIYDNPTHKLVTEERQTNSDGSINLVQYQFPEDITTPSEVFTSTQIIDNLISKNIVERALKIERFNNTIKIEGGINTYNFYNGNSDIVLPSMSYRLEGTTYEIKSTIDEYDNSGNVLQVHVENGNYVTYLWGYNYSYPILKIENATYDEVMTTIGGTYSELQYKTDVELTSIFNSLRTSLPNAFVSSYLYKPLIGMVSETKPNGITTFYDYDEFGRLETIKDHNGKIVKHIDYNYKSQ